MKLSVVIPAHNEAGCIERTVRDLYTCLKVEQVDHEILVVNDNSSDETEAILKRTQAEVPTLRYVNNTPPHGFGFAVRCGLDNATGDAIAVYMADASDRPDDLVRFFRTMETDGVDCVFGSRFLPGARTVDYPRVKLLINRAANAFIQLLFGLRYNDVTNAFKLYKREVIEGVRPLLSHHFNLTVELPLKAIVRGYTYSVVPNDWINRKTGISKLKINEMGSRYMFIVLYCLIERWFSKGDYRRPADRAVSAGARAAKWLGLALGGLVLVLYLWQMASIARHGVDLPYADEWEAYAANALPRGLTLDWLFARHNEHRIVTTKLAMWGLHQVNGLNMNVFRLGSYVVYGLLLMLVFRFSRRYVPWWPPWGILAFLLFLCSTLIRENHVLGFQVQFHLGTMLVIAAAGVLFRRQVSSWSIGLAIALLVVAIYSFTVAVPAALALWLVVAWDGGWRWSHAKGTPDRARHLAAPLAIGLALALVLPAWYSGYVKPPYHPPTVLPTSPAFWAFFVNLVSFGFGFTSHSLVLGAACVVLCAVPVAAWFVTAPFRGRDGWAAVTAVALGLFAAAASVSLGRAAEGVEAAKISRYGEFSSLLVPFTAMGWCWVLRHAWMPARATVLGALWVMCLVGYSDDWAFDRVYRTAGAVRNSGLACIEDYYTQRGDGECLQIYGAGPLGSRLDAARVVNASFFRRLPEDVREAATIPRTAATPGVVFGRVVDDRDGDGQQDPGEPLLVSTGAACADRGEALDGLSVVWEGPSAGVAPVAACNPDPYYRSADLRPGMYTVSIALPPGWARTTPADPPLKVQPGGETHRWFFVRQVR